MSTLIITLIIGFLTFVFALSYCRNRKSEAHVKINFIDYQENNFYNIISLIIKGTKMNKKWKIKNKSLIIRIDEFKNKEILKGELALINTNNNDKKKFDIKLYKNHINTINIQINNKDNVYYYSEFIFYSKNSNQNINVGNLEFNTHGSLKRKRLLIYNFKELEVTQIIKDNNNNKNLENSAINAIKNNSNKYLLINIYASEQQTNILIFIEQEKFLIRPNQEEKLFFENLYTYININRPYTDKILDKLDEQKKIIIKNGTLFGKKILNLDDYDNINNYFSFINQGINCLLENNIIANISSDYYFILGYIIFYVYIDNKKKFNSFLTYFFANMNFVYEQKKEYSYIDLIRIAVSFALFFDSGIEVLTINFSDTLGMDNKYKNGFEFFKNIILDLNEDSDLIFIYLQINSGYGLNLINQEKCYKLSMLSVEDIKSHIIRNIPKYFYTHSSDLDIYIGTDSRTQVMCFNEYKLFDESTNNKKNNNIMNIVVGMLHESGLGKFHMNTEVGGDRSPLNCVDKTFNFTKKYHYSDNQRGESGRFIDHFLYNSVDEAGILIINSLRSNELMDKSIFIGNLNNLNDRANNIINNNNNIIINTQQNAQQNIANNGVNNISALSLKLKLKRTDDPEKYERLRKIGSDIDY